MLNISNTNGVHNECNLQEIIRYIFIEVSFSDCAFWISALKFSSAETADVPCVNPYCFTFKSLLIYNNSYSGEFIRFSSTFPKIDVTHIGLQFSGRAESILFAV